MRTSHRQRFVPVLYRVWRAIPILGNNQPGKRKRSSTIAVQSAKRVKTREFSKTTFLAKRGLL